MRVVRAGRSFRVILHAEERQRAVAEAFERVVIQINVRQLNFTLSDRIGIDGEVMVVRRDLDFAAVETLYRMVAAVMPKLQLVSPAAECEPDELMSKADAEDWRLAHQPANVVPRIIHWLGIAGAVREEDTIGA